MQFLTPTALQASAHARAHARERKLKTEYAPIDAGAFNAESPTTWINLGLWSGNEPVTGHGYASANRALALAVLALLGDLPRNARLIDFGCGRGEFLRLLSSNREAVGVNVDASECAAARERAPRAVVVNADAVAYAESLPDELRGAFACCVDAAYHFNTRARFVRAVRNAGVAALGMSDICLSQAWEANALPWWRAVCLACISAVSGAPRENLRVGPRGLRALVLSSGFASCSVDVITDKVLEPFAAHSLARARLLPWGSQWAVLWSSAWFMRLLARSGAVDVVLVRASSSSPS